MILDRINALLNRFCGTLAQKICGFLLLDRRENFLDLGYHSHREIEKVWIGSPAESDLSNRILDMPDGMCAFLKEDDVPGVYTGQAAFPQFQSHRAVEDQYCLFVVVVPVKPPSTALPNHGSATGSPSIIQERSIGLNDIFELVLATSISVREIPVIPLPSLEN